MSWPAGHGSQSSPVWLETATSDAWMSPALAGRITALLLDGQGEVPGDIFVIVQVMPAEGYGLQPGDGDAEIQMTADCLSTIGRREYGVLEAWPTYRDAARRCRELHLENTDLGTPLLVQPLLIGRKVVWWDTPGPADESAGSS